MNQLAPELLGAIVDQLDLPELARLSACSKPLQRFTEPVLYGTEGRRALAMHWACVHGNLPLVRKAVLSYGASPSAIARPGAYNPRGIFSVLLTLYLAAKHQQDDALLLLLSLGARLDNLSLMRSRVRNQVRKTTRWLARRHPALLLQAYLDARCDDQVRNLHCPAVAWPLVPAIRAAAPPALVRLLVERGASPNQVVGGGGRGRALESPLSAAISRGSRELVDMLVEKGADIHGREVLPPSRARAPTQIPVFAAAQLMATSSSSSPEEGRLMMNLCLEYGADINQHACVSDSEGNFHWITPLLGYLDSVPWGATAAADAIRQRHHHQETLDGISYFFDQGATDFTPMDKCPPRPRRLSAWHYDWIEMPYPIEMLLDRWKLHSLTQDRYFPIIELLAQRSTNVVEITRQLLRKHACRFNPKEPWSADVRAGWRRLLEVLLAQQGVDINLLLFYIIVDKGSSLPYNPSSFGPGILFQIAIESLLAHGADINTTSNPRGTTAIHDLCEFNSRSASNWSASNGSASNGSASNGSPILTSWNLTSWNLYVSNPGYLLFDFLMEKGANPTIAVKGKTAIDLVLSRLDRTPAKCKPFILELAAIMRADHGSGGASRATTTAGAWRMISSRST